MPDPYLGPEQKEAALEFGIKQAKETFVSDLARAENTDGFHAAICNLEEKFWDLIGNADEEEIQKVVLSFVDSLENLRNLPPEKQSLIDGFVYDQATSTLDGFSDGFVERNEEFLNTSGERIDSIFQDIGTIESVQELKNMDQTEAEKENLANEMLKQLLGEKLLAKLVEVRTNASNIKEKYGNDKDGIKSELIPMLDQLQGEIGVENKAMSDRDRFGVCLIRAMAYYFVGFRLSFKADMFDLFDQANVEGDAEYADRVEELWELLK